MSEHIQKKVLYRKLHINMHLQYQTSDRYTAISNAVSCAHDQIP